MLKLLTCTAIGQDHSYSRAHFPKSGRKLRTTYSPLAKFPVLVLIPVHAKLLVALPIITAELLTPGVIESCVVF